MELSELVPYNEERCKQEQPILYICGYTGPFWTIGTERVKKDKPSWLAAGLLEAIFDLRGKSEMDAPPQQLEYCLSELPFVISDFKRCCVEMHYSTLIDMLKQGDLVTLNRAEYEHEVLNRVKVLHSKDVGDNFPDLIDLYFRLVTELEQRRACLLQTAQ